MRHALTGLLSAASLCAFAGAIPAAAQTPTIPSQTGAPAYSYHRTAPRPAVVGQCEVIAGNHVCNGAPAYGSWAYGYPPGGPIGAAITAPVAAAANVAAAPVAAAANVAAAPVAAAGAVAAAPFAPTYGYGYGYATAPYAGSAPTVPSLTGAPAYSYHYTGPIPAPAGQCQVIAGNRVCNGAPAYGYGYGPWWPVGAAVAAPVAAAGTLAAAPVAATAALTGAPVYAAPAPGCQIIAGNRVCSGYVP